MTRRARHRALSLFRTRNFVLAAPLLASGCLGVFSPEPGSRSIGTHARGALVRAVALPVEGEGYAVHPAWRPRERQYATEEVVRWLRQGFAAVSRTHPGSRAWLGDLSGVRGGGSREHKSHASGRDVDIFFYATDPGGGPLPPAPALLRFDAAGRAVGWSTAARGERIRQPVPEARFDAKRTWALVQALLADERVEVQWIFIDRALSELVLREAAAVGAPAPLISRAADLFHQPKDAQPHDDHMHVRIYCDVGDRVSGCIDRGPQRWWKKRWKYMGSNPVIPSHGSSQHAPTETEMVVDAPGVVTTSDAE